jgi:hypothetical protein
MENCGERNENSLDVDVSGDGGNGTEKDNSSKVRHLVRLFNSMSQISLSVDNDSEITQNITPNNDKGPEINTVHDSDNDHAIRDNNQILNESISGVRSYVTIEPENRIPSSFSTHVQIITSSISENHEHETQQSEHVNTNRNV